MLRVMQKSSLHAENGHQLNKGGFPLLRKFYVPTGVNLTGFTCVNKIKDDV